MFTINDVLIAARLLNITFDKFSKEDFLRGINVELEHGLVNPSTNVTNNDLITTSKIALAHLNEFSNYYNKDYGITKFEEYLKTKNKRS